MVQGVVDQTAETVDSLVLKNQRDVERADVIGDSLAGELVAGQHQARCFVPRVEVVKDEEEARQASVNVGAREVEKVIVVPQGRGSLGRVGLVRREAGIEQRIAVVVGLAGLADEAVKARRFIVVKKAVDVIGETIRPGWVMAAVKVGRHAIHPEPPQRIGEPCGVVRQVIRHADHYAALVHPHLEGGAENEVPGAAGVGVSITPNRRRGQGGMNLDRALFLDDLEEPGPTACEVAAVGRREASHHLFRLGRDGKGDLKRLQLRACRKLIVREDPAQTRSRSEDSVATT